MAGWHHRCNEQELGQILGDGEGQRGLVCCSPWGCKELDMTELLNNNNLLQYFWATLVAQMVKNPLAMWETWV